jgi:hypothetical protein
VSEVGGPLVAPPFPDVRESTDAGAFYCAHSFFLANQHVGKARVARDQEGDPMIGFLHVPPDPWTLGGEGEPGARAGRHDDTIRVVAAALRGWVQQLDERPLADDRAGGEVTLLVTGFGPFRDVVDNPTGALCSDSFALRRALDLALPDRASSCVDSPVDVARAHDLGVVKSFAFLPSGQREVTVLHRSLDVEDPTLAATGAHALRPLLDATSADAWLGLGVCRSRHFRVEVRPTSAGLELGGPEPAHAKGAPAVVTLPDNRSLCRAIVRGAPGLPDSTV